LCHIRVILRVLCGDTLKFHNKGHKEKHKGKEGLTQNPSPDKIDKFMVIK
jgi:hypothetical protein